MELATDTAVTAFSPEQEKMAVATVMDLMKSRRFFLSKEHTLDPEIFSEPITFFSDLHKLYASKAYETSVKLLRVEGDLGIRPVSKELQETMVVCNLHDGGLEICDVYPIQMFSIFIPETYQELFDDLFFINYGEKDSISPRNMSRLKEQAKSFSDIIWQEFQGIKEKKDGLVVIMKTKFSPDYHNGFHTFKNKVRDFIFCPEALAYLFYKQECCNRLIEHNYVLFSGDQNCHQVINHWKGDSPSISFNHNGGYDSRVKFAYIA